MLETLSTRTGFEWFNEGGPARKLNAAARAVMEPVEARVMMSVSVAAPAVTQVSAISAKYETQALPDSGQAAAGNTVWVNPNDASQSLIIGADKSGGLGVYDLSGNQLQFTGTAKYRNVDVRNNVLINNQRLSIIAAENATTNTIDLYTIDASSRTITLLDNISPTVSGKLDGLTMYQSADTLDTYVFVSTTDGSVEQLLLNGDGQGGVTATSVRTISLGSAAEGLVADDATGALYVSQDNVAIWKYGAEPTDGSVRTQIDDTAGSMGSQPESLGLYAGADGSGYLIASRQDSNDYVVYDRQTGDLVTSFKISGGNGVDAVNGSDGIAISSAALNSDFPGGVFVAEDDNNTGGNQNYKIVSWNDIASATSTPLAINGSAVAADSFAASDVAIATPMFARAAVATTVKAAAVKATATVDLAINSLDLYQAQSSNKIQTIKTGEVFDLADLDGTLLNIRANTDAKTVGSVVFSVNGKAYRTENTSTYDLAGTDGTWTPTVGKYTITATAYSKAKGTGTAGTTVSVTFTVIDSSTSTTTTSSKTKPAVPTKLTATVNSTNQITLNWTASSGATGYYIERSTDNKTFTRIATITSTSYANSSLTAGTKYYYRMEAYNTAGASAATSVVSATTTANTTGNSTTTSGSIPGAVSLSSAQPSATNTGTKSGTKFTTVSGFTGQSNTTYSNLIINGEVNLKGLTNVTLINCIIDGASATEWGVRCDDGATNILIQNCEIRYFTSCAVYGEGYSAIGNYVHHIGGDGFKPTQDALIQGNYVTQLGWGDPTAHADGVQIRGGSNIRIQGNFFNMPINVDNTKSNSSLFLQLDVDNVVFTGNWCLGGNYTIHAFSDDGGGPTVKITNNIFYDGSAQFGYGQIGTDIVWTGNTTTAGLVALPIVD